MSDTVGSVVFNAMLTLFAVLPFVVVIGFILHYTLLVRLDPILFKEPYFHKRELGVFTVWPFTMMKAVMYMMLVACPRLAKYKRFKGFDGPVPVGKPLVALCYIEVFLLGFLLIGWIIVMTVAAGLWLFS